MTICLLFMLPKNRGKKNPSLTSDKILTILKWFIIINLQISNLYYKDDSKCLISQNEKENQKTEIVNM